MKKLSIILILLALVLCVGVVSASDNNSTWELIKSDNSNNIDIKSNDSTNTTTQITSSVKKVATEVDADDVVVIHKKKSFFKIKVENDDTDKPINNLKLKIKVFTKNKSKTYTVKTNSKGIAKFNTNKLSVGKHKVIVTSADEKYKVNKKAKIIVGKKHTVILKPKSSKKLKNKDTIKISVKKDGDEKELKVVFKGSHKYTKILKATFYLKNKFTGKIIKKTDHAEFDDGIWELPDEDYSYKKYVPVKVKVTYISYK